MSTLLGWALMNAVAAFFAASSRFGATSVADMLFETSIAMMTVPAARVTGTDAAQQTQRVLENLKAILEAGGSNFHHVVKTTVFLKDMNDFAAMNEVYARYFTAAPPARSTVQVARLPKDALVEIELIAAV